MANNFFYTDIVIPAASKLRLDGSASGTTYISESADGRVDFYADNKLLLTLQQDTQNQVILNNDSGDVDFRVKSIFLDDAFFVQGNTGYLGIGTDTPGAVIDVVSANNTLLRLTSSDDSCRIQLSDDDTTGYLGVTGDEVSLGHNGTLTSTNNLRIKDFSSGGFGHVMAFGATPSVTDKVRFTRTVDTDDDVGRNVLKLDLNVSGSAAISGDRTYQGLFIDLDSTSTSGDTTDEVRLYGVQSNILDTGDADLTYGVFSYVKNNKSVANDNITSLHAFQGNALTSHTAGHVTTVRGANINAQMDNAGGTVGTAYGGSFNVSQTTDSDKVVPTVYGVYAKVDTGTNSVGGTFTTSEGLRAEIEMQQDVTMPTARAVHALLDVDDGTITNAYQFYGSSSIATAGAITNHYGIYTTGSVLNRLAGTLQITNIPEIGSDTDKFIMSDGQVLKYVTGDNLRSYIGAGTGTVTISGTPVAKEFAEWTDATTIKGSDTLAVNSSTDGINILGNDSVGTSVSILRLLRNNAVADDRFQFIIGSSTENYIYSGNSTNTHSLVFGLLDANNSNIEQVLKLKRGSGVQIPVCNEIGSDTDKFLMVSGTDNLIEYVTGDNLLSYIGGAPSSGGAYLPLAGGTMNSGATITMSGNLLVDGANITIDTDTAGNSLVWMESDSSTIAGQLRGYGNRGDIYLYDSGVKKTEISSQNDSFIPALHIGDTTAASGGVLQVTGNATFAGDVIIDDGVGRITLDSVSGTNRIMSTTTGFGNYELLELRAEAYEFKIGTTEKFSINDSGNATFAGDLTVSDELTVSTISNATADPDKFLCANGNGKVGYRTGAQVLSDIGAGTVSGNGVSGRVAFWSGSSIITSDADLTFDGSILTVSSALEAGNSLINTKNLNTGGTGDEQFYVAHSGSGVVLGNARGSLTLGTGSNGTAVSIDSSGNTTLKGDVEIGVADGGERKLRIHGGATGTPEGGQIELHTAADYDTTYAFYRIDAYQDDFRIGREGLTDIILDSSGKTTFSGTISSTQGKYESNAEVVMSNSSSSSTLNIGDAEETDGISLIRLKTAGSTQITVDDGSVDLNTNVDFSVQGGDIKLLGDANINLDVSLSTGNTSGIILPIGSGSVVGGKFYYFAGLSWSQTDADNESSSKGLIAYAKSSGTPSTNRMLVSGIIYKASHGFVIGTPLYLSTNPGDLQATAPSGPNDVARVVGYALDANHIFFRPDNTWVKIS